MTEQTKQVFWLGSAPKCDIGNSHELNGVFFDARIPGYNQWGLVCPACASRFGVKLGTGYGQKYKEQPDGRWLKIEG